MNPYFFAANFHQINHEFVKFLLIISRHAIDKSHTSTSLISGKFFSKYLRVCSIAVCSQKAYFTVESVAQGSAARFFSTFR
ncbi:hypothetical protein IKN40_09710 [bacterium]|nr:hypothetical protein [bacterium]